MSSPGRDNSDKNGRDPGRVVDGEEHTVKEIDKEGMNPDRPGKEDEN